MRNQLTIILLIFSSLVFAQKQTYNIGFLLDNTKPELQPVMTQMQDQIMAVVGEDAEIQFPSDRILLNRFDLEKAQQNYAQLLADDTDIILAFGVVNNAVISQQSSFPKPVILFGAVNSDFIELDLSKNNSGIDNFTYLIDSQSFLEDFKVFKELAEFNTLGIAIEAALVDFLPLKETFDKEFQELNASYKLIPFSTPEDITQNLDGIDAVYLAGGFFLSNEEINTLAKAFVQRSLPSFTSLGIDQVKEGIMGTNQADEDFSQFLRRIALTVEGYVNGMPLSEMPVYIESTSRLTVNFNTADAVGVSFKYSLINDTDFVGEMKNAYSDKQFNLLEVINGVLDANLFLQSSQKEVDLSTQDVKAAKSNYLPSLTAAANGTYTDPNLAEISNGQNPEFQTAGNITLQQTVFSEAANANISIQKSLQKAQQENFNTDQLDLIFDATNVYFNVLILKTNAQVQLRNLNLTKRNLEIATQNFEAGQSGKSDMLRFRSQMAQNTQSLVQAVNQLEQSFIALNQLLNNPVNTEIDIEDAELGEGIFDEYNYNQLRDLLDDPVSREPFIEFLIEEAKNNAPELKSLGYNLDATERNLRLNSAGRFLPTVALQGQYNQVFNRSGVGSTAAPGFPLIDNNYSVGLNVSIPILNQNLTNINRQTAIIQKDQLNINKENTELAISANVRNGVLNLVNEISNIELSKVSEETAKEALELTQTSYSNGAVTIIQLIDAQNNYLNAQLDRANAIYNYLINALQLERFLGYYFLLNSKENNDAFSQRFLEFLNTRN
ncbi:TolC family protein [Winogradskyella tangerina]|uniref:TolC family protein n=1 Tax=Winogradskyella tangerina TaxID=2023240 RepID=UPI000DBE7000|nr:TolC family protein [Winogradskyella tangerina]